ncbi:hypothetical protein KC324_g12531 [Hortaea werneckii]|nr:hypothetical protein KC324_g12531 [Hortaea werneckii]
MADKSDRGSEQLKRRELKIRVEAWLRNISGPNLERVQPAEESVLTNLSSIRDARRRIRAKRPPNVGVSKIAPGNFNGETANRTTGPTTKKRSKAQAENDEDEIPTKKARYARQWETCKNTDAADDGVAGGPNKGDAGNVKAVAVDKENPAEARRGR